MNTFLTGSRAYGVPAPESDIDLVVLCDAQTAELLHSLCDDMPNDENPTTNDTYDGCMVRFGRLNLIITTDESTFAVWRLMTNSLINSGLQGEPKYIREAAVRLRRFLTVVTNGELPDGVKPDGQRLLGYIPIEYTP